MSRNHFINNCALTEQFQSSNNQINNKNDPNKQNYNLSNYNHITNNLNNSYNANYINESIYKIRYPNSSFDFDKKMDYLILTNAFTKLRNQNNSYEELENLALKLEISNIKYSQKLENLKYEIIRLNQKMIDLNSIIKESEIENKKLFKQITFYEKDREIMLSRIQTQEFNFLNSENNNTKMIQSQATDQDNNLLDNKYLVRTSNDLDNNPLTGNISENPKQNMKNNKNQNNIKNCELDNKNSVFEENQNKSGINSIIEDTDSSLIEGFENNESLLDSIKRRENKHNQKKDIDVCKYTWNDILTCNEKEKKMFLNRINKFDMIKNENEKLQKNLEENNNNLLNLSKENKTFNNNIKEKDEIIQILYKEIENLKKDIFYLNQNLKSIKINKNKDDQFSENNELSDISPTTHDVDSEYNSPALKKIKNFIKENSNDKNINYNKIQNTPSTVNKNFFYKNNNNYDNFLKKSIYEEKEYCKSNRLAQNSNIKGLKSNAQLAKENEFRKRYFGKYSNYENDEYNEKQEYQALNTDFGDKPKSVRMSKNNFTFQENEIIRQNESSNFNSHHNNFNNSDYVLKCENDKKIILKNLEDLKKDLDLFLKEYGIKEQFNKDNNNVSIIGGIDFQIEYKFKEIRYITVNLKKINIIFKSLFVEFTKNIANNMDKINDNINKKLYVLQNRISIATGDISEVILNY